MPLETSEIVNPPFDALVARSHARFMDNQLEVISRWFTKINLYRVAKGERPLSFALCKQVREYLARKRAEREVIRRPLQIRVGPGGLRLLWRTRNF